MEKIMEVKNLEKTFGNNKVLNNVSFDVYRGEVLCILGPNGAGKTTTINILTAALNSNSGEVLFNSKPISKNLRGYKQLLGIVPQDIALYEELTAERNLRFFASLYGLHGNSLDSAVDGALEFSGLSDRRHDKVKTFSGGMKRRLNIACAIAHHPQIVIMDEPTVGIDPQSRNHILNSIKKLQSNGMTVIYTTHYMEEVESISSRIIIMDHGNIIAEGTKESLKESVENEKHYTIKIDSADSIEPTDFLKIIGVKSSQIADDTIKITSDKNIENLDQIIALITKHGSKIININSETASLEMVFLKLTGRKLRD
jgi:ABC-2 type transport system ATP-binding protein